jgi:hypothetical protein
MGSWNPTLREVRETWGIRGRGGAREQQVSHRAFSPVRNDKSLGRVGGNRIAKP